MFISYNCVFQQITISSSRRTSGLCCSLVNTAQCSNNRQNVRSELSCQSFGCSALRASSDVNIHWFTSSQDVEQCCQHLPAAVRMERKWQHLPAAVRRALCCQYVKLLMTTNGTLYINEIITKNNNLIKQAKRINYFWKNEHKLCTI